MFLKILTIIVTALGLLYAGWTMFVSAADELIVGRATVIDGDTFEIGAERVRLFGVDAPELEQVCDYNGKRWLCGSKAALDLAEWMGQATIVCRRRGKSYYRTVASCLRGGVDVAKWSVRNGLAVADTCYSQSYVAEQDRARAAGRGIWSSTLVQSQTRRIACQQAPNLAANSPYRALVSRIVRTKSGRLCVRQVRSQLCGITLGVEDMRRS